MIERHMELEYIKKHTIFETVVGSRAYGIHSEDSDYDKAGVAIPDINYFFGLEKFEQFTGFKDEDKTIYDIRKAISLILENNPNMMDLLWTSDKNYIYISPYWHKFIIYRDLFTSRKVRYTFGGYAFAQLKRIKMHRKYLLNPPKCKPVRRDYNLPEISIFPTIQLKSIMYSTIDLIPEINRSEFYNELDEIYGNFLIPLIIKYLPEKSRIVAMELLQNSIKSQAHALTSVEKCFLKDEYIEEAKRELFYYNDKVEWDRYEQWKKTRNPKRRELEIKIGYDAKHASHLVRLLRMGIEILETGIVNVDRTNIDAEELKSIRNGAWTYNQVEEYADKMDKELNQAYNISKLQYSPDRKAVNNLLIETIRTYIEENK